MLELIFQDFTLIMFFLALIGSAVILFCIHDEPKAQEYKRHDNDDLQALLKAITKHQKSQMISIPKCHRPRRTIHQDKIKLDW